MSDSVRPHRRQPTRLPHSWDSPGKNTGVGCHFLLQCMKVKSESEVAQSCPTLSNTMDCSLSGSSVHGIFQARVLEWAAIAFSGRCIITAVYLSVHHSIFTECSLHTNHSVEVQQKLRFQSPCFSNHLCVKHGNSRKPFIYSAHNIFVCFIGESYGNRPTDCIE